ncbi:hypothetical protein PYJP_16930 [Pyrofollis japonicus]|uniref:sulfite exporter TauE/SafE family protein n=1 Tax=Pyrofollis japonicus TaxID=3060460 RepID=UPI00295B5182|nr:sulfite exporter TauE/SafE family protein [Pyrofollis japonicus]BEP18341.1 hypothetical protein PYJP_16930 [Pyrofollis japonicus]
MPSLGQLVLYAATGFLAGLLDYGFAAGFGLVASLVLVGLLAMDPRAVSGAAALAQVVTAAPALRAHQRHGNTEEARRNPGTQRIILGLSFSSLLGAVVAGSLFSQLRREAALLIYPVGLLGLAALLAATRDEEEGRGTEKPGLVPLLYGFAAGAYKAVIGGGYSAFMVLAKKKLGLGTRAAIALTPVTKLPSFLAVAATYAASGHIDWSLTTMLSLGALASTPLAAKALHNTSPEAAKRALVAVLVAVAVYRFVVCRG